MPGKVLQIFSFDFFFAAGVASFGELLGVLGGGNNVDSALSVLKALQQVAVLVQGNWVAKSDLLYPKDSKSESGVPNELIQRGRDYVVGIKLSR